MNYVTTNIRLSEETYLKLKEEAAKKRVSLAEVIRIKLQEKQPPYDPDILYTEIRQQAARLGKKMKGFNSVEAIREMRYNGKW